MEPGALSLAVNFWDVVDASSWGADGAEVHFPSMKGSLGRRGQPWGVVAAVTCTSVDASRNLEIGEGIAVSIVEAGRPPRHGCRKG